MDWPPSRRVRCRPGKFYQGLVDRLLDFAERTFEAWKAKTEPDPSDGPPPALAHVWGAWRQLNCTRDKGFDFTRIKYIEIEAWMRATGNVLMPMEVEALAMIDAVLVDVFWPEPKLKPHVAVSVAVGLKKLFRGLMGRKEDEPAKG